MATHTISTPVRKRTSFGRITLWVIGILAIPVVMAALIDSNPTRPFQPAQATAHAEPLQPQIFILARKPDSSDRYADCEVDLVMSNLSSEVVSMSGTVQGYTQGGGDGTGYFSFEFVEPGKDKLVKARLSTYCRPTGFVTLVSVIVREINVCKLSGDYYRDCGAITAPGKWADSVTNTVPLRVDLK
jgi:hypothetical protein